MIVNLVLCVLGGLGLNLALLYKQPWAAVAGGLFFAWVAAR